MSDGHLQNTIRLVQRVAKVAQEKTLQAYLHATPPTAEHASMAFDSEFENVMESTWEDYTHPLYDNLILEAARRDLPIYDTSR